MSKTILTQKIEESAISYLSKLGTFVCPEVGITTTILGYPKYWRKDVIEKAKKENWKKYEIEQLEIVDILCWESNKDIWRCYEIKISKNDFHSKCKKTFVGNYNYYIMTKDLWNEVSSEIPQNIGVLIYNNGFFEIVKKPKFQELSIDKDILCYSMIKSLYRENQKIEKRVKNIIKYEIILKRKELDNKANELYKNKKKCDNSCQIEEIEKEIDSIDDKISLLNSLAFIRYLY